jgi:hypothetical protein
MLKNWVKIEGLQGALKTSFKVLILYFRQVEMTLQKYKKRELKPMEIIIL